ncbi:unnamed protein product [Caenorhabditis bovis]|uniref:Uncharacterized protein n=1 Tax=Caenorhabditis bovis TaxID=2654633 RepID=A0A8S1EHF2_9PELO|nr:unnamed protein product [Caenorhabditis bovis]
MHIDKIMKDPDFAVFINNEFNYSSFLSAADHTAEKYVPFQDSSNDTYFRIGLLHRVQLDNYTKIRMEDHLGSLKNKPWMPINEIREEFANCAMFKYGTLSKHDFKYDKGMYGWMNMMKFSCFAINEQLIVFAMAFARTRFRLKQVFLKQQNTGWATSGRSLITRDVQKITEIFSIRFSNFVNEKLEEEYKKIEEKNKYPIRNFEKRKILRLKNDTFDELAVAYGRLRKHIKLSASRGHTFNTLAIGVTTRVIVADPKTVSDVVEAVSNELSDAPLQVLANCHKETCSYDNMKNMTYNKRSETHTYLKENALIHTVNPRYSLIVFQTAKPYFIFETLKRKTATKVVEIKQHANEKARELWTALIDQQFALAIHLHNQNLFPFDYFKTARK